MVVEKLVDDNFCFNPPYLGFLLSIIVDTISAQLWIKVYPQLWIKMNPELIYHVFVKNIIDVYFYLNPTFFDFLIIFVDRIYSQ